MPDRRYLRERSSKRHRPLNRFEPRKKFLIVCEGKTTEPNYFRKFPLPPDSIVDVEGIGANTDGLVREAIRLRANKKYHQVWVVFDRDAFTVQHFNNAIQLAAANGIFCAYSNEAFELWYYLHFHYLDTGINRHDYCTRLSNPDCLGYEYAKNSRVIYDDLLPYQQRAIQNAKKLLQQYNPPDPVNDKPSTTVFKLVEQLNQLFWE